jgi:hypothetical protein
VELGSVEAWVLETRQKYLQEIRRALDLVNDAKLEP